ncbi:retrovirus-related pol polyprotein from transposon TNT 1-94, partial [Tanacetum coccineum]
GNNLLTGTHGSDLYTISLQETSSPALICFMANASLTQARLWHRRFSHLNFDTINLLSKKDIVNGLPKLKYIKDQLCPSCEIGLKASMERNTSCIVERQNRTLVEVAQTMLLASKLPLFFWVEAIAIACYTQNRDGENLNKIKEKGDPCIFVGYSTQSKGYRVYNKRTRLIVESIHINFDELKEMTMTPDDNTLGLAPQLQNTSDHNSSKLGIQDHNNEPSSSKLVPNIVPLVDTSEPSLQQLDLLFSPLFEEYFTAGNQNVSKFSALYDNSQKQDTQPTLNVQPTIEPTTPTTNVNAEKNNTDQAADA